MDDPDRETILRLCTEAGMRMEDASVTALTIGGQDAGVMKDLLAELVAQGDQIGALLRAARALIE
ncbi:MAG: hypothetical protein WA948_10550 [Pontixanthobacter sp.]